MMIRPGIYCDKAYQAVSASDEIAFECTLIPVTAAIEIHRSERKPVSSRSTTGLLEAAVAGGHLEQATSVRHTNTAPPTVTPATSLCHGESDIANTNNASNQTHQARGT